MDINFLDIQITDTQENNRQLSFEGASVTSIKLVYNGQDDKFGNILTSEVQFTFLVKDNTTAKYFHLFAASETRYKVEVIDVSVVNFPKTIWVGYLLPEQFSEPYKNNGFFVEFVATDGVALLKTKDFPIISETEKVSVIEVFNRCLKLTGLTLPLYFSEAIQNSGFNLSYLDIVVQTAAYKDADKEEIKDAHTVLDSVLKSIGCALFLFNGAWYVIGINKFKERAITFIKYTQNADAELEFNSLFNLVRPVLQTKFIASPVVSVLPPLQKMETVWDWKPSEYLMPEDVVTHLPVNLDTDPDDLTAKYWNVITNKGAFIFVYYYVLDSSINVNQYYNGYIATSSKSVENNRDGLIFQGDPLLCFRDNNQTVLFSDLPNNFITLTDSFFVDGSDDLERYGTLNIKFTIGAFAGSDALSEYYNNEGFFNSLSNNGSGLTRVNSSNHNLDTGESIVIDSTDEYSGEYSVTVIDDHNFDISVNFSYDRPGTWKINPFKSIFHFAITYKEHLNDTLSEESIYLSNFSTTGIPEGMYDFSFSIAKDVITVSLTIEKILLLNDGYYNVRFYSPVTHPVIGLGRFLIFSEFSLKINQEDTKSLIKKRDLDYTTSHSLDVFHSSSRMGVSNKAVLFSEALAVKINNGDLIPGTLELTPVSLSVTDGGWFKTVIVVLNASDYNCLQNGYDLFLLKTGYTVLVELPSTDYVLSKNNDGEYILTQTYKTASAVVFIEETDTFCLKSGSTSSDLAYAEYWLDKWRKYDAIETKPMYEVVNDIYHSLLASAKFMVTGTYLQLISPLDLVAFTFQEKQDYYPVNISMNLHQNTTEVTIVVSENENITDYE